MEQEAKAWKGWIVLGISSATPSSEPREQDDAWVQPIDPPRQTPDPSPDRRDARLTLLRGTLPPQPLYLALQPSERGTA